MSLKPATTSPPRGTKAVVASSKGQPAAEAPSPSTSIGCRERDRYENQFDIVLIATVMTHNDRYTTIPAYQPAILKVPYIRVRLIVNDSVLPITILTMASLLYSQRFSIKNHYFRVKEKQL